jgi:23S rRNA (uridine2552-2'-O)-methyltransferase
MSQRKDAYYARAKAAGYRSRAAYKLLELQRRYHLLRRGDYVVDLGAAPGAWLQVACNLVGPRGRVVGVDTVPVTPLPTRNVVCFVGNALDSNTQARVLEALGGKPTVILSDMAPRLSGVRPRDQARCAELVGGALDFAVATLAPGGRLLAKVLMGADVATVVTAAREHFDSAKLTRPQATRKGSSESYVVATGFRAQLAGV